MEHNFQQLKIEFDNTYRTKNSLQTFLPIHLSRDVKNVKIRNTQNILNEEYFKWQFAYSIVKSNLYPKDNIGTEVNLPKGNSSSNAIKLDIAIFKSSDWFNHYENYHKNSNQNSLNWLRENLLVVVECKKENSKNIESVWNQQLKSYLKESERSFCLGVIYDTERMYLFKKLNNKFIRYSENFNLKGLESSVDELTLETPDPYIYLPSFKQILKDTQNKILERNNRNIEDLLEFSGHNSLLVNDIISNILKTMNDLNKVDINGFRVLIQILTLKIYDELNNSKLNFYILDEEFKSNDYSNELNNNFNKRISSIVDQARVDYKKILSSEKLDLSDKKTLKLVKEVVHGFQDYSFLKSQKTDIYQLVFYKFAAEFTKADKSQFLTPLEIIKFMVSIVNPKKDETIFDPTCGIGDFLSIAFVEGTDINDKNLFGLDIDSNMIMLSTLNMLLNGDGNAKTYEIDDPLGSIKVKFDEDEELINLLPHSNQNGDWEQRQDGKKLKKFDVILTNPPFGDGQAFEPKNKEEIDLIQCYETWNIGNNSKKIDKGVIFLENAYRSLSENGKLGIVLSSSILGIKRYEKVREWLWTKMRIVAFFDLPSNVFFDAGINSGILIAYKPSKDKLIELQESNYEIFTNTINNVGYTIKEIKRIKVAVKNAKKDPNENYNVVVGSDGSIILEEDFTDTISQFKKWANSQEDTLKKLFL